MLRHYLVLAAGLTLLVLVVTGCGLAPTHTSRASDQWSNGKLVGTASLNNQVALQVDDGDDSPLSIFMVWVGLENKLNFARLNEHAEVLVEIALDLHFNSPLKPQLLMDATGQLHLTWLDRWDENLQLFYARLSADGEVIQEATALSPPERRVSHSSMVLDSVNQTVELFWSDNTFIRPGCFHAALDWSGVVVVPPENLIPDGLFPTTQIDSQGFVHLAWSVEPEGENLEFHYAVYDPQRRALGPEIVASEPLVQMGLLGGPTAGATFDGPWLGLDESSVFLAWVLEVRERGQVMDFTFYQAFPQPALSQRAGSVIFDYPSPKVTGEAVQVTFQGADPARMGQPRFLEGQPAHQVLACSTQITDVSPGSMETLQIVAVDLQPGQIEGHAVVNASRAASLQPNVEIDSNGHLHLVWIDTAGFNRYRVIYASTSTQAKETLNRITAYDIVDRVLSGLMNVLSAFFFIPMIAVWVSIPIAWLVVFSMATRVSEISEPLGRRALGLAMLLQVGVKILLFPDLLVRLQLGYLLSPPLSLFLGRWIFPLLLAAVSTGVTWIYLKRTRSRSIFTAYLIYAFIDSLLTMIVYVSLPMMG